MLASPEHQSPLSWSNLDFTLVVFDLVYIPGGHDKAVQQIIDSPELHNHLAKYFPLTRKSSLSTATKKAVAAICHGPMVLANTIDPATGKSVLYECTTTALPAKFEQVAYWGTRLWLGDYYKTYGKGSEDVEESVVKALKDKRQFRCSLAPTASVSPSPSSCVLVFYCFDSDSPMIGTNTCSSFVAEDNTYNYISARFPGDIDLFSERVVQLMQNLG